MARADFTFVCPTELRALADLRTSSPPPALADVRYPVLADTSPALGEAYGVLDPDGTALRATFPIDPEGVVRHASVSDQAVGRSPGETLRVVQAPQTGELCPVDWRPGTPTLRLAG